MGDLVKVKKIEGVEETTISVTSKLERVNTSASLLNRIGEFAKNAVVEALKRGETMASGKLQKLDPLSVKWIEQRKKLASFNNTAPQYSPAKSNVSFTGQLLNAFDVQVRSEDGTVDVVVPPTERTPYKTSKTTSVSKKNTPDNEELVDFLREGGRDILGKLDDKTTRRIKQIVVREIKRKF